jgi:hypothetical protein
MNFTLPAASSGAPEVDHLLWALLAITVAVLALVFGLMFLYIIKYRAGNGLDRGAITEKTWKFETAWTVATLLVFFGLFLWGADLYVRLFRPPSGTLKIYVIAKQWMWKVEHPGGQREINALHLPVGRPIELVMTSEDVIHDFSVPAFRIKHDVLPDRYETLWFTVTPIIFSARSSAASITRKWWARSWRSRRLISSRGFRKMAPPAPWRQRGKCYLCGTAAADAMAVKGQGEPNRRAPCALHRSRAFSEVPSRCRTEAS